MPAGKSHKGSAGADPASGGDRIGALPDEILHRVLHFLPAHQVVQTCVLARRWLDLWKSATALRIVAADGKALEPFEGVREFVDNLMVHRGISPLGLFELRVAGDAVDVRSLRLWVRYAVRCNVQALRLNVLAKTRVLLQPKDPSLASRHLTMLELRGLVFNGDFLDFSRCPALQHLHITDCVFEHAGRISSQSLKHLNITRGIFNLSSRTQIHTPNLALLVLQVTYGRTPVLERMPLLVWAIVGIMANSDCCSSSNIGDCGDESCKSCIRDETLSVLLHGMSQAKTLDLRAGAETFIFRRDLKWRPTFSRLKTLLLDQHWCVPDVHALACILEHSPVLEKLILSLFCKLQGLNVIMIGRFNPKELPPTISAHVKRVEIRCGVVDERVIKVLKFLSKLNISKLASCTHAFYISVVRLNIWRKLKWQTMKKQRRNREAGDGRDRENKSIIDELLSLQEIDPEYYTDTVIKGLVLIILSAGSDTSALTTEWAMALLLTHPEAMQKVRAELDANVGRSRLVEESDIANLPYLQCVVKETLRLYPVSPVITPHEAVEDCTVGGYHVRRGTMILVNAWMIQRDPKLWEAPEEFRPERFLDAGMVTAVKAPMLPFGLGRRRCPGEGLAMRLVSLTLAALVQCFEWDVGEGGVVDMSEGGGLSMPMAKPLAALCRPREFVKTMLSA